MLTVQRAEAPPLTFLGFKDKDSELLRSAITSQPLKEEQLATRWAALSWEAGLEGRLDWRLKAKPRIGWLS